MLPSCLPRADSRIHFKKKKRGDFPGRSRRLRCLPSPPPVHNDAAATGCCGPRSLRERGYAMGCFFGVVGGHVMDKCRLRHQDQCNRHRDRKRQLGP
jgi:hypothetical protein